MRASAEGGQGGGGGKEVGERSMVVAAIDFGTTYSGCAYSFRSEWEEDPLKIYSNNFLSNPNAERNEEKPKKLRQTEKVPTTILLNPEKEFVAFGYEAENMYTKMIKEDEEEAKRWFCFSRFKMKLHTTKDLDRDLKLLDFTQKKGLPAIQVFSEGIRYLRGHVLAADKSIREEDVEWVLTVPAIWSDKARQFMREAARQAGIPDERLSLALEPEAASVLCLEEDRRQGHLNIHQPGSRFMVVDNGGGTVDITVYEVVQQSEEDDSEAPHTPGQAGEESSGPAESGGRGVRGVLRELHHPTGGPCAGVQVDKAFKDLLTNATSVDAIASTDKLEILDLDREFEEVKRNYTENEHVFIKLPLSGVDLMKDAMKGSKTAAEESLSILKNRLKVPSPSFKKLFTPTVDDIIGFMTRVQENLEGKLDRILLVGGFSDCLMLQSKVKEAFPEPEVLIPPDPAAAVLKGAVLFRHDPSVIGWRASAFTYGIEAEERFIEGRHNEEKAFTTEKGTKKSREVFASFIKRNEVVKVDSVAKQETFLPCERGQTELVLPIFKSDSDDPVHTTDEGCEKLGKIKVHLQNVEDPKDTEILVEMCVGGTELIVRATNAKTTEKYATVCDFLSK